MFDITKTLSRDKQRVIQTALSSKMKSSYAYVIDLDEDKSEVYFDKYEDGAYKVYKVSYQLSEDNTSAEITSEPIEVVSQTQYVEITKAQEAGFIDRLIKTIDKHFGGSKQKSNMIIKQFDEDQMIEIGQMYVSPLCIDAHDDSMSHEEIVKMVAHANDLISKGELKANYDHSKDENGVFKSTEDFSFIEATVAFCDCYIGNNFVSEGTPLLKAKYHNKDVWKARKDGGFTGWSIGGKAGDCEYVEIEVDD